MPRQLTSIVPPRSRRLPLRAVALPVSLLAALAVACGGGDEPTGPATDPNVPVASIRLVTVPDTMFAPSRQHVAARVLDRHGRELVGREVEWWSSHPSVAHHQGADSSIFASNPGVTEFRVSSGGRSASFTLTVLPAPVARVVLRWAPQQLGVGESSPLYVEAQAASGFQIHGVPLSYESSDTSVVVVGERDGVGSVRAVGEGEAVLTVRAESASVAARIRVGPTPVARLDVAPLPPYLAVGDTARMSVTVHGLSGGVLTDRAVTYQSNDPHVLRVSEDGLVTALAEGTGSVQVRSERVGRARSTHVIPEPAAALVVAPAARVVVPGAQLYLAAQLRGESGTILRSNAIVGRYESSDPSIASIDHWGSVRALAPGRVELRAIAGELTGTATLVVEQPPAGAFRIRTVPVGYVPSRLGEALARAAARWERVIVGALPAQPLDLPEGACDSWTPALNEVVDGVTIFVNVDSIDGPGGVLGFAGPCVLRGGGAYLPVVGLITLDRRDVEHLLDMGMAADVLAHEIGHVLGIGTIWNFPGVRELVPATDADPRFVGPAARDAAWRAGFLDAADHGVAVETAGGEGTAGAHWRESAYSSELMTGWIASGSNPLSLFTVGALGDLGYVVHEGGADDFSGLTSLYPDLSPWAPVIAARREAGPTHRVRVVDRLVQPRLHVDRFGRVTPVEGRTRR